jgi:hypothetical protein
MSDVTTALAATTAAIAAIGGLGTASFGLVDATKAFDGGFSNFGFGSVKRALAPFAPALTHANADWLLTIRANWINGVPKEDQKAAARSLIRLGLCSANAAALAPAGHVDPKRLADIVASIESGGALKTEDANVLGRFNGAIDAAMDAGFERGDQEYRNACRLGAAVTAVVLSVWAGALASAHGVMGDALPLEKYWFSDQFGAAVLAGLIAVPLAPMAKDLASSLQAAAKAVKSVTA